MLRASLPKVRATYTCGMIHSPAQPSRTVTSPQTSVHDGLDRLLQRHRSHPFEKPIAPYNQDAFAFAYKRWQGAGMPAFILDSGCGVGLSTLHLAARFPDHLVIGVDQSADRLGRDVAWPAPRPENVLLVRADLADFWRLLARAEMFPAQHFLLYPNPWPKKKHLARRWHGHAVFPEMLLLGGHFECRSNWKIYIDECAHAVTSLTGGPVQVEAWQPAEPEIMTPFERKYLASGHALWRCTATLARSSSK